MSKKKGPQMAHPHLAEQELANEIESLIDTAAERVGEEELAEREQKANQIVENVRERASRLERA
jgi:ElaB/YqjD/DUF883 family membrane-anchored ribosome-binding protein